MSSWARNRPAHTRWRRGEHAGPAVRGAGRRALAFSLSAPGRVLLIGAVLAIAGWGVGTRIPLISDIRQLVPKNLPALQTDERSFAALRMT